MKLHLCYLLFVLLSVSTVEKAYAFAIPSSKTLPQTIAQAQTIAVVSLNDYQPSSSDKTADEPKKFVAVGPDSMLSSALKQPGRYTFHLIKLLKGKSNSTIYINLPYLLPLYYGGAELPVKSGNKFILFFGIGDDKKLEPIDMTVPIVPVTENGIASAVYSGDIEKDIFSLMIASCSDTKVRQSNTYLLQSVISPQIVSGLFPYIDDNNLNIRDNVLVCMATNQQVAAIPRISILGTKMSAGGAGTESAVALRSFQDTQAVPYLNPLLFTQAYYVRLNAMFALDRLADHTSIPYFLMSLHDPDPQNIIPVSAYDMLHNIIPALGKPHPDNYYAQHRTQETAKLYAWWTDELNGKHLQPGEALLLPKTLSDAPAQLNTMLFVAKASTRQAAAVKLSQIGDATSIPYLIVALQDPDEDVAYSAYKTLHRLVPKLSVPKSREDFSAGRSVVVQPIYDWWRDELLGKHLSQ